MRLRALKKWFTPYFFLFWVFAFFSFGQYREYFIYGKVVDTGKKPIARVEILLQDQMTSRRYVTRTDNEGEFKLVGLPHGIYDVTVKREGYRSFQDTWNFETPQDRMQKVEMTTIILATESQVQEMEKSKEAQENFDAAMEKLKQEDFDGATVILDRMLNQNPGDANAHYLQGIILMKKKMIPEAIVAFQKTVELVPHFAGAYHQIGLCYQQQGEQEKALEFYKKAGELEPRNVTSLYNAGLILFELNRIPEALNYFEKALEQNPRDADFLEMAGRCHIHQGDFNKAIVYLENALQLSSNEEKKKFLNQLIAKLKEQIKTLFL